MAASTTVPTDYNDDLYRILLIHLPAEAIETLPKMNFSFSFIGDISEPAVKYWDQLNESGYSLEANEDKGVAIHAIQKTRIINEHARKRLSPFGCFQYRILWKNKKCLNETHKLFLKDSQTELPIKTINAIHLEAFDQIRRQLHLIDLDELIAVANAVKNKKTNLLDLNCPIDDGKVELFTKSPRTPKPRLFQIL